MEAEKRVVQPVSGETLELCGCEGQSATCPARFPERPVDPNAAMIQRDEPKPAAAPKDTPASKQVRSPLLTVAAIPKTGFSLWGADHQEMRHG